MTAGKAPFLSSAPCVMKFIFCPSSFWLLIYLFSIFALGGMGIWFIITIQCQPHPRSKSSLIFATFSWGSSSLSSPFFHFHLFLFFSPSMFMCLLNTAYHLYTCLCTHTHIYFLKLCLLIVVFSPFTCNVIADTFGFKTVLLLFCFCLSCQLYVLFLLLVLCYYVTPPYFCWVENYRFVISFSVLKMLLFSFRVFIVENCQSGCCSFADRVVFSLSFGCYYDFLFLYF